MEVLKETEWLTINKVILEIYDISDINLFSQRIMRICRMLIPYSKGYFILFDDEENINVENSVFIEMSTKLQTQYLNYYYKKDYMRYIFDISNHTITFKDTDLIDKVMREKTEFFTEFLQPNKIPYGAGILLRRNCVNTGIINFFRSEHLNDFSQKDMFILEVLKEHLSHALSKLKENDSTNKTLTIDEFLANHSLSKRETEVLNYVCEGHTNKVIAEIMYISESTIKKHINNIFSKCGVNTRTQLLNLIYTN